MNRIKKNILHGLPLKYRAKYLNKNLTFKICLESVPSKKFVISEIGAGLAVFALSHHLAYGTVPGGSCTGCVKKFFGFGPYFITYHIPGDQDNPIIRDYVIPFFF